MTELENFIKGDTVRLPIDAIEESALTGEDEPWKRRIHGSSQPFTAHKTLAKQAMIANAEPTNNSRVEGGFSLASGKWRGLMRRATARWWSATIRKKTMLNADLEDYVKSDEFLPIYAAARAFCCKYSKQLKELWYMDLALGADMARARKRDKLPDYVKAGMPFEKQSNIAPPPDGCKRKKLIEPASRHEGAKGSKRHRDSDNSEFEDSDVEPDDQDCDHDMISNQGSNAEDEDLELAVPDDAIYGSDQSQGQDGHNQPSVENRRRQRTQPDSVDQAQDAAPVQGTNGDEAQPILQEGRESEAVSDDELAGVDLDAIEAQAAILTASSTNQGFFSSESIDVEPEADAEECSFSVAELEAAEKAAEATTELQEILDRYIDSDVSLSEHESQPYSMVSYVDREQWAAIKAKNKPYQLEHARLFLLVEPWVDSKVTIKTSSCRRTLEGDKRLSSLTVERADGIVIPVYSNDGSMLYLIAEYTGPEMVYVTDIIRLSNGDAKIRYLRVLNTRDAYASCDRDEDLIETRDGEHRSCVHTRRLGKDSLKALIDSRGDTGTLHHWGDVFWETCAKNIVGLVGWLPVAHAHPFGTLADSKGNALGSMRGKGLTQIKSPDDLHWVIVGDQFSDCNPDKDQPQEQTAMPKSSKRNSRSDETKATKTDRSKPATTGSDNSPFTASSGLHCQGITAKTPQ